MLTVGNFKARPPTPARIRFDGAFDGIVSPDLFFVARGIILERNRRPSNEVMLAKLRALLERNGELLDLDGLAGTATNDALPPTVHPLQGDIHTQRPSETETKRAASLLSFSHALMNPWGQVDIHLQFESIRC
jgi:hypothetical protein